jgi:pyrimidine and pyridine-specific 5'-nucleotidase
MYPYSLLRRPSSQPLFYSRARSRVSTTCLRKLSSLLDLAMSVESNYGARSKAAGNLGSPSPVILMAAELSRESPFQCIRLSADGRMNDKYLVSAGVDKVLVIWDFETGEKIARFGQQPNISAGLHLVHDKLISITIDGVARAYDVGKGEMIRQFKISDLSKQVDSDTEERKAVQDIGAGSGGSGMVQWASGSGSTVTVSPKCPISPRYKLTFQCATKTLMVTMRWEDISADDIPSAKPAPRKSLPSTLGTPRILRSATTPAPSPITPQRQRMLSMKASSITASPLTASPALIRSTQTRPIAVNSVHVKSTNTGSPSVSSRMTSSIGTTAATSEQSVKPVSAVPEKTGPITVPDLSRVPQIIEVRRTPEVERGVFDPTSGRLVTSTRFAARAGSEKKIYVSSRTTTNELGGDWAMGAAMQGLDTPVKRPTCLTMDGEKLLVSSAHT